MPTPDDNTPYSGLNPDLILDAIESVGFHCSGSLLSLNSYENRVYQIGIDDASPIIAKFYRPKRWTNEAILEEHSFAKELIECEIPVVAPLEIKEQTLHSYKDFRFALFPREGGRALELENLEQLEWMGRFLGRLHAVSATKSFTHRTQLTTQQYGYIPYRFLIENNFIPAFLKTSYCQIIEIILPIIDEIFQKVDQKKIIRLHGDCHVGNILWNDAGPRIVDLDDCMMGPAIQDIWMLLSGDKLQMNLQIDYILEGYQEFCDFNFRELHLIEPLRTLRMIHYSGWLAKRWKDPAFPINFPWFNTSSYWEEQVRNLNDQLELLNTVKLNIY